MVTVAEVPFEGVSGGLARTLRALVTGTTHLVGLVESDGTIAYACPATRQILGYDPEALVGTSVFDVLHPEDHGMAIAMLAEPGDDADGLSFDDADASGEYRVRHAEGHWIPFEVLRNDFRADPAIDGVLIVAREVQSRRALDDALSALADDDDGLGTLAKLAEYLDLRIPGGRSAVGLAPPGTPGSWVSAAGSALPPAGWLPAPGPEPGLETTGLESPGGPVPEAVRAEALAGGFEACWWLSLPVRRPKVFSPVGEQGGEPIGSLVVWSARYQEPLPGHLGLLERVGGLAAVVLRRRAATRALRHLANHDDVTGVLNRVGFEAVSAEEGRQGFALMVIDLDNFKDVNDSHGHRVGDEALRAAAERIEARLGSDDVCGRLGGDEFVVGVGSKEPADATVLAVRLLAALSEPLEVEGKKVWLRGSIGIAPYSPGTSLGEQMVRADQSMYAAKRAGKGRWELWAAAGEPPPPPGAQGSTGP